jgi:HAD superfamily hydrolase (TIGR01509 family)
MFLPKAVLFDMDGVILDTEPSSLAGWRYAAAAQGFDLTREVFNSIVGTNVDGAKERLLSVFGSGFDYGAARVARSEYIRGYRNEHGVPLKKGVIELLDRLDVLKIPRCVATSTNRDRAVEQLDDAGLTKRFNAVIGGDSVTHGKPHPEIYLKAAAGMGVPPEDCFAVEDSRNGVESAYRAGTKVILVPDLQEPDEAAYARAYAVCGDLIELAGLL